MANKKSKKAKPTKNKTVVKKKPQKKAIKKVVKKNTQKEKPKKVATKKSTNKVAKKVLKKISKVKLKTISKKTPARPVKKATTTKLRSEVKSLNVDYSQAITPLADRLVVRVLSAEKVTAGGLIIPATASFVTGYLKAEVLAVGSGVRGKRGQVKPLDVRVGDHVLFAEYSGTKVSFNAEELQIIHESDVMGVLQN